jgi:PAS domain S-box-containing protein
VTNKQAKRNWRTEFLDRCRTDIGLEALDCLEDVYLFVKDDERRFVLCNAAFLRLMGQPSEDHLLGLRDEDLSPEYLVEKYRRDDETVLAGQLLTEIVELVRNSDGSYEWFMTAKFPLRNATGGIIGLAGVTRNLTKRQYSADRLMDLAPAVEMMMVQYAKNLTIADLAAHVSLSPSQFTRRFKKEVGISPHRFLQQVRLDAACDLLVTNELSISTIARNTGFYDQSHLANEVMKSKALTPSSYRDKFRRQPAQRSFQDGATRARPLRS